MKKKIGDYVVYCGSKDIQGTITAFQRNENNKEGDRWVILNGVDVGFGEQYFDYKLDSIKTLDELRSLQIGTRIHRVINNDVRDYRIACHYPDLSGTIKSVLITFGTNEGCSGWISQIDISSGNFFYCREAAVEKLISDMESDLEAVKRIYREKNEEV